MQTSKQMEEFFYGSQNFSLKLEQDSTISNVEDANNDEDVIVISDSSSKSSGYTSKYFSKSKSITDKYPKKSNTVYVVDSSDSDSVSTGDEKYLQALKASKKSSLISNDEDRKSIVRRNKSLYTSDESSNSTEHTEEFFTSSSKTTSTYLSCNTEDKVKSISKADIQPRSNVAAEKNLLPNDVISSSSTSYKSFNSNVQPSETVSSIQRIHSDFKGYLSRKDTKNIFKNIRSTRVVYESPKVQKKKALFNEEDDDNMHPAILSDNLRNNIVLDETPVNSQNDIIPDSQANVSNLYKSHVSKFLNTPHVEKDLATTCTELSEKKKKQITQWLNENSPDSLSDSSPSIIPPSNKNDISSGNSSLERLEMNYETPNNRGKINQLLLKGKGVTNLNCNKTVNSSIARQTTINEFVQRTKNNTLELHTPKKKGPINNNMFSTPTNPTTNTPTSVDITDCMDILDKLYGKSWRSKADVLFPNSEPRKPMPPMKNRAVQTERKSRRKGQLYISDSDDDSDTSLRDLNLKTLSTKRITQKNSKKKDSFINDEVSSGSGSESLYYTALSNPRTSSNSIQSKSSVPPVVQRLHAICDSDNEVENDKEDNDKRLGIRRKKLSYDNDKGDDSSTSEFDPGDDVPLKSTVKKGLTKSARQTPKLNIQNKSNFDDRKWSFLASLSGSVPISNVHPEAKKYRLDFKNTKEDLCNYLYKLYNEKVFDKELPEDMAIEWNIRMRGTAGYCYNKKSLKTLGGIVRSSRIVLATKILDTPDRLRDTLIHEMCHAAAWLINGVSDGHGPLWTKWANKAMHAFPELPPIRRCHDYEIKTKFTYKCVGCGYSIGRHSKSLDIERKRCGHCYSKFELLINKTTKTGTVQVQTPKRELTGFALYVKENYNSVKKERNIKHAEVMKILGQQFSAIKIAKKQENIENNQDTSS